MMKGFWVTLSAMLLAACASSPKVEPAKLTDFDEQVAVRVLWRVEVGDAKGAPLLPAVLQNAVYAAAHDGTLVRIDPLSGETVWRINAGNRLSAGVGSDGFTVAVATAQGDVLGFDAAGKSLWKAQVSSDVVASPLVGHGLVIVRATDHRLTAFDAKDGSKKWVYQRQQPPLTLRTVGAMHFIDDTLVAGFPGGRLVGIAVSNGAARWEAVVAEPKGATEVERLADVLGPIAVTDTDLCAVAYQGRILCVDSETGNVRWARAFSASTGVALDDRALYTINDHSHVEGYARSTGAQLWRNDRLSDRRLTAPVRMARGLVVGDFEGFVHVLAPADGAIIGRTRIDSSPIVAAPQVREGMLVMQTQDGTVASLSVE